MATAYLIEGPVGAGKTTFASQLGLRHRAPRLVLDDWMARLFGPDRPDRDVVPWYMERKRRCIEQIFQVASDLLDAGSSVVLELGLLSQGERRDFYGLADAAGWDLRVYVLGAPLEVRRQRVQARNSEQGSTFSMVAAAEDNKLASRLWQPPSDAEVAERGIEFVTTA